MSSKVDAAAGNKLDVVKWLIAGILLFAGLAGFYYFSEVSALLRVVGLLVAAGVAVFLVSGTDKGRKAWGFMQDTHLEVRKVVWPSRRETVQTTAIVLVMVLIIAVMIWLIDSLLFWIVQTLTT